MNEINGKINVTHVNVRSSISILLLKLVVLELIAATLMVAFRSSLLLLGESNLRIIEASMLGIPVFYFLVLIKTLLTAFIILQWLNDYYEITAQVLFHRKGLIFKSEIKHPLEHVSYIVVNQGIIGKIFNFGDITLFDIRRNKVDKMSWIHNPMRYAAVIEGLLPSADEEKNIIREHIIEEDIFDRNQLQFAR